MSETTVSEINEENLIKEYFMSGHKYLVIVELMKQQGVTMSVRTLKRRLHQYGLQRRLRFDPITEVKNCLLAELSGPAGNSGYRSMWHILKVKYGLNVRRSTVYHLLKAANPIGMLERSGNRLHRRTYHSPGPNHCWHVDGYDKLKSFGFPIHGCIDGYSRKILWLKVHHTNNNPNVIATHYAECLKKVQGCPQIVRSDCGTENGIMAALQATITGSEASHCYGTSPANQRIEAFWSYFRKLMAQWWIDFFEDLVDSGEFSCDNEVQKCILQFSFMKVLQNDLNETKYNWNRHRIRRSSGACCPPGVPNELYFVPHLFGGRNCLINFDYTSVSHLLSFPDMPSQICHDKDYEEYLQELVVLNNLMLPNSINDSLKLYFHLKMLVS